ncbi:hypothetical protein SO802_001546 [Lithocarpus litseifolius]|uniref:Uncharacterized protein n=1 Tax=Lithocarpus litseifolius TaxID=425828 RepID=A0AAW2DXE0_9ROSI
MKTTDKGDRPPKKPKVVTGLIVGETPPSTKLPPSPLPGKRKGLMTGQGPVSEKCPVLLREDSRYAIGKLSSIIKDDDYEDLGNHATEAMGETGLFSLAHAAKTGLRELEAWKEVQIKKLDLTKKALEESERQTEVLGNVLKDKKGEIFTLRKQVLQAKEDGKTVFRNFDAFLYELGGTFVDGFNDCFHQVKASFPNLDLSQIFIDSTA